jgi:pilus assembly protein CpaC
VVQVAGHFDQSLFRSLKKGSVRRRGGLGVVAAVFTIGLLQAQSAEVGERGGRFALPSSFTSARLTPLEGVQHVTITVNKSGTFKLDHPFGTASVGAPAIVDAMPLSDRVIYLQGKNIGTTNVSLFDPTAHLVSVIDVEVVPDVNVLRSKLRGRAGLGRIEVAAAGGQIVLSGVAPDALAAERALEVARGITGGNNVVNAMEVAPSQQVLLEVRVLEATRTEGRDLGVNLYGSTPTPNGGFRTGTTNQVAVQGGCKTIVGNQDTGCFTPSGIPIFATANALLSGGAPFGTFIGRLLSTSNGNIDIVINALEQKGLVRRLAEPNLTAISGHQAAFRAGGQFPYPTITSTTTGATTPTITFAPFGVQLQFTPTVLAHGIIDLHIIPTVSELDFGNAVQISGTVVPSIVDRTADTRVELRDGQSFAIAGLLSADGRRSISQLPWVGSVPVLGTLFRSALFQNNETDLVIVVTPHLVSPAAPNEHLASPLDSRLPSNDVDFFLNGQPEVKKQYVEFVSSGGGIKGPYGHIIRPYGPVAAAPAVVVPAAAPVVLAGPVVKAKD